MQQHLLVTAAVIAVLIAVNLLNNKWATRHYLMICFVATALLLGIARFSGISWEELGLARGTWLPGLYWSAALFGAVALFYAIAASLPFARKGFSDKRAAEHGWTSVLYESTIRIPFGTALLEETAFRAVLLAVVADGWGLGVGCRRQFYRLWFLARAARVRVPREQRSSCGCTRPGLASTSDKRRTHRSRNWRGGRRLLCVARS